MSYGDILMREVFKIRDRGILDFTNRALSHADSEFWHAPCSSSGRFHPPEDNGDEGLIRHLIKAVAVTKDFARRAQFSQYELDLAFSATILHDICKNGRPWGERTDYRHGIIGAEYLSQFDLPDKTGKQIILDAVRYHMSPWITTLPPEKNNLFYKKDRRDEKVFSINEMTEHISEIKRALMPHSIIERCVQEADYWASRETMSYFPGVNVDLSIRHDKD